MSSPSRHYLASLVLGIAAAFLACVIYIVGVVTVGIGWPLLNARFGNAGTGGGSAMIESGTLLVIAVIGFAFGFVWRFRRSAGRRNTD